MDLDVENAKKFITELIKLTETGKITWRNMLGNLNICEFLGRSIVTDWERDDKPTLIINTNAIVGYGFGIEELLKAIDQQCKRRQILGETDQDRARKSEEQAHRERQAADQIANLNANVKDMLKGIESRV